MLDKSYLYFRRVDTYQDDIKDSDQPIRDKAINRNIGFEKQPEYKLYDYYRSCRARTYACCFSTENSNYIWENYSAGDPNAICLIFNTGKLKELLNKTIENSEIIFGKGQCRNFFDINYGSVKYGDFENHVLSKRVCSNPIEYSYFKDSKYQSEKEFRITLSAIGLGKIVCPDGSEFCFPDSVKIGISIKKALLCGAISSMEVSPKCEKEFSKVLCERLLENEIETVSGCQLSLA